MAKKSSLGLIEFLKGQVLDRDAAQDKKSCPKCSSTLIVKLANQLHCNSCGCDFAVEKHPIARRAHEARRDAAGLLANKSENIHRILGR
jgi:hypothetical protein